MSFNFTRRKILQWVLLCITFMDRWSNVSLKIRMTLPPYMNDRQYHVNGPCPTPLLDKWLLAKLIDVYCCCHVVVSIHIHILPRMGCLLVRLIAIVSTVALPYIIHRLPMAPIAVYLFLIPCVVVFPPTYSHLLTKGWFVAYVHIDPIKADLVSYTKIHGQDKLILTQ